MDFLRVKKGAICEGRPSMYVKIGGKMFHLMHKVGTSRNWIYRSTPFAREMLFAALMKDMFMEHSNGVDCVIRGHAHYYWECGSGGMKGYICYGWKLADDFLKKLSISMDNVSIGYTVLRLEDDYIHSYPVSRKYHLDNEVIEVD